MSDPRALLIAAAFLGVAVSSATAGTLSLGAAAYDATPNGLLCYFGKTCKPQTVNRDSNFPYSQAWSGQQPFIQSIAISGETGTKGAGLTLYMYRISYANTALSLVGAAQPLCSYEARIDFGPFVPLSYDGSGKSYDAFVVSKATGGGTNQVASAVQSGTVITFKFAQPVCPHGPGASGQNSVLFGAVAKTGPRLEPLRLGRVEVSLKPVVVAMPVVVPIHVYGYTQ